MTLTVGELKEMLAVHNDSDELYFCGLDFYRLKVRGPGLVQVEFDQQVYKDEETGRVVIEHWE